MEDYYKMWDHTFKYFELHAAQRISTFNFFIVISTILTTANVSSYSADFDYEYIRPITCISLMIVSFVFWKLDNRVRFLIHTAEGILQALESLISKASNDRAPINLMVFAEEQKRFSEKRSETRSFSHQSYQGIIREPLTYSNCFNILYLIFFIVGLFGLFTSII